MGEGRACAQQSGPAEVPGNQSVAAKHPGKPTRAPPRDGAAAKTARRPDPAPPPSVGTWVCVGTRPLQAPRLRPARRADPGLAGQTRCVPAALRGRGLAAPVGGVPGIPVPPRCPPTSGLSGGSDDQLSECANLVGNCHLEKAVDNSPAPHAPSPRESAPQPLRSALSFCPRDRRER